MRNFCFFIEQEGGMDMQFLSTIGELRELLKSKSFSIYTDKPDEATIRWFRFAEVGEFYTNRLGCIVRLKDDELKDDE